MSAQDEDTETELLWVDFNKELKSNPGCLVGEYIESLPDKYKLLVKAAMDKPSDVVTGRSLYASLRKRGLKTGHTTFRLHRRKACSCYPETEQL